MTGRLRNLGKIAAVLGDDLADLGATQAERDASAILNALHTAILLDDGNGADASALSELAGMARAWMTRELVETVNAMLAAERERQRD